MNNIKKGLVILSLALVCVAGFATTASVKQPAAQPSAAQQSAAQQPAPEPAPQPVPIHH